MLQVATHHGLVSLARVRFGTLGLPRSKSSTLSPMSILHYVTYTLNGCEQTAQLSRTYRLTYAGAERILRKTIPGAIVTRIDTFIDAR